MEVGVVGLIEVGVDDLIDVELLGNAGVGFVTGAFGIDFVAKFDAGLFDEFKDDMIWFVYKMFEAADGNVVIGFVETFLESAEADDWVTALG